MVHTNTQGKRFFYNTDLPVFVEQMYFRVSFWQDLVIEELTGQIKSLVRDNCTLSAANERIYAEKSVSLLSAEQNAKLQTDNCNLTDQVNIVFPFVNSSLKDDRPVEYLALVYKSLKENSQRMNQLNSSANQQPLVYSMTKNHPFKLF